MLVNITSEELTDKLAQVDIYNGMANRFLWAYVQRRSLLADPTQIPESAIDGLVKQLGKRILAAREVGRVQRSQPARNEWRELYHQRAGMELPPRVAAVTERADAQQLRLQLIFAALDGKHAIRVPHVHAAKYVWEYCEESALYLFGESTGNRKLDKVLAALRGGRRLTQNHIRPDVLQSNVTSEELEVIEAQGAEWGLKVEVESEGGRGRPPRIWWVEG